MTQQTLGERLADLTTSEKRNTREAAQRLASHTSAEALRDFRALEAFFEKAQSFFTTGIEQGLPVRQLEILVGSTDQRQQDNTDIYSLLKLFESTKEPKLLQANHPLHSLWANFAAWCRQNGLEPVWHYRWDGGGMCSWWVLTVKPLARTAAPKAAADSANDVTVQHSYCLHVLSSVLFAYEDALRVMRLTQGPAAQEHFKRFKLLIDKTGPLGDQLGYRVQAR